MIKRFNEWLLENEASEPKDPQTHEEVKAFLDKWEVKNWTINDDLSVDVKGRVYLDRKLKKSGFNHIPIKFRKVEGRFDIDNNDLSTLEGLPEGFNSREFFCSQNKLITLEGLPEGFNPQNFFCGNNSLTTLEGLPEGFNPAHYNFYDNKAVSEETLKLLSETLFKEGISWKQSIIKHFDEIPDNDWKQMTLEGQKLLPKEEFKKKYMGAIASKRLGL